MKGHFAERRVWVYLPLTITVLSIVFLIARTAPNTPASYQISTLIVGTPTLPTLTSEPTYPATIDVPSYRSTVLAVARTIPTYTPIQSLESVQEKYRDMQREELYRQAEATVFAMENITRPIPIPFPTSTPDLTPRPGPPTRVAGAGVIVMNNYCGNDKLIATHNKWRKTVGPRILGVCAGSTFNPPYQGIILVEDYDTSTNTVISGPDTYQVPGQAQWVEVVDAVGERVILQADTGYLFYFDVPTRQWVSPPPLPTPSLSIPPLPTLSPALSPLPSAPPLP